MLSRHLAVASLLLLLVVGQHRDHSAMDAQLQVTALQLLHHRCNSSTPPRCALKWMAMPLQVNWSPAVTAAAAATDQRNMSDVPTQLPHQAGSCSNHTWSDQTTIGKETTGLRSMGFTRRSMAWQLGSSQPAPLHNSSSTHDRQRAEDQFIAADIDITAALPNCAAIALPLHHHVALSHFPPWFCAARHTCSAAAVVKRRRLLGSSIFPSAATHDCIVRMHSTLLACTLVAQRRPGSCHSPPNHRAISFCAFSTLSLPWMTLRPTSMA